MKEIGFSRSSEPDFRKSSFLKKIWQYRNLLFSFTIRDIKAQYAQTRLGIVWGLLQATIAALILNFFFGILLKIKTDNFPYIIYAFPGMMAWYYFSYIVNYSGNSVLMSQNIVKKIYFPKLILPLYKTLVGLIDFCIWFVVYLFLLLIYKQHLTVNLIFMPLAMIFNIFTGLSIAIWLSAISVKYRDALHFIPFLIGFGAFITPVFYETVIIPEAYHYILYFNPMAGVIAFYRWCLLGISFSLNYFYGIILMFILLITGLWYFYKNENSMSDLI
jgi:lipopolysaccharide transport system permease protein